MRHPLKLEMAILVGTDQHTLIWLSKMAALNVNSKTVKLLHADQKVLFKCYSILLKTLEIIALLL